jgi:putative NADPH-quinone reductase
VDAFDFAVLVGFAYALRKNAAAHKRLIIIATAGITGAAFFRWHITFLFHDGYASLFRVLRPSCGPSRIRPVVDAQAASRDDLGQRLSDLHGTDQPLHRTKCALACVCTLDAELGCWLPVHGEAVPGVEVP